MFSRNINKQNKFKRFILKLLNVYAYDKETLNIVNPHYDKVSGNLIDFNNKSFSYSRGYLNLSRKVKKLDIYFRYAPTNNLWNSTGNWKRIVQNIDKKILISVCLISLKESILKFLKNNNLNITVNLVGDNSDQAFDDKILKIMKSDKFKITKYNSKIQGNRGSYLECCNQAENAEDLIFFIEDDYLFESDCIEESLLSFSKISSLLDNDIIICPSDYSFYYDSLYKTSLFVGNNFKWRKVNETLLTFMFTKKIYAKYKKNIRDVGETINEPFEKPLHDLYNKVNCLAPINSLAYHITRTVPSTTENWKKTWIINFNRYQSFLF